MNPSAQASISIFLGLGSSQEFSGNSSREILELACQEIENHPEISGENFRVSSFIQSQPWGGVAQNIFVNAACRLDISPEKFPIGSEEKFLDILQDIEKKFGRVRDKNSKHWADRTLDIDILFWGNESISRPRLSIPHPFIWERDFVFEPLQEICTPEEIVKLKNITSLSTPLDVRL